MKSNVLSSCALVCSLGFIACQPGSDPASSAGKIIHGKEETGFPFVVPIQMDGRYFCTGTFLSDSILLTAAHCVEHAASVEWLGSRASSTRIYIHPRWPTEGEACRTSTAEPKYDVALVQFPAGTYTKETAHLLRRPLQRREAFTIVGYGNNKIIPFERYCTLPPKAQSDGLCHVLLGTKKARTMDYSYTSVLSFEPGMEQEGPGCPVDCGTTGLKDSLTQKDLSLKTFVTQSCDGNFRDRSYQEKGVGTKRSGTNRILSLDDGTITFDGDIFAGDDSVSGSGDSGGPLFVREDGRYELAGVTHGGRLKAEDGSLHKLSIYADLTADPSLDWIKTIAQEQQWNIMNVQE